MKYCESKEEVIEDTDFGAIQIEQKKKLKFIWGKRRRRERDWWKIFWKNMTNYFGDGKCSRGENLIWRIAKKERWKEVAKNKSKKRGNNHRLQKLHINYRLDISNISNEAWKEKWKNKITQRYRLLHQTKERETIYKGIISLHPKVDMKHFEE
jgi:cell division protein FtsB